MKFRLTTYFIAFYLLIFSQNVFSQGSNIDSCIQVLHTAKEDSNKVILLNNIGWDISFSDLNRGLRYGFEAYNLAKKINYDRKMASICTTIGAIYNDMGQYEKTLAFSMEGIEYATKYKQHFEKGDLLNSISALHQKRKEFPQAISYARKAMTSYSLINDGEAMASMDNNIGGMYHDMKMLDSALFYMNKSLNYNLKNNKADRAMYNYVNLAEIYYELNNIQLSYKYSRKVVELARKYKNNYVLSYALITFSKALNKMGKAEESIAAANEARAMAEGSGELEILKDSYSCLSSFYENKSDHKMAVEFYKKYMVYKDSMLNNENIKQLANAEAKYENEKKQREIELLGEKQKLNDTENQKKKIYLWAAVFGIIILGYILVVLYRNNVLKQKTNKNLEAFNIEVNYQKVLVDVKNKEITDSINYAKRIQQSILTSDRYFKKFTTDFFILFKPKDIVSGDFYWALNHENKFIVMTADCTGHGVPGAMMSMMGINFLNEIVNEKKNSKPADILNQLRSDIIKALNPEGSTIETKDGMDCCLCSFDFENMELTYANANNNFYIIRNNQLIVSLSNKMPVGAGYDVNKGFEEHMIGIQKDDLVITLTDGYADQFGGQKGKKYKYKQLEEVLLANAHLPLIEIKKVLDDKIELWKGDLEQVDDICIIGIKI